MTFLVGLAGAMLLLLIMVGLATFVPKNFSESQASAPDPGTNGSGGGSYEFGSHGLNEFSGGDAGDGDAD